jgi:DNA gyrase/topoisomerase IV subunit B
LCEAGGTGTTKSFLADKDIFTTLEYDFDTIFERLRKQLSEQGPDFGV